MADDTHKLEIESNLNETVKHVIEGTPPDYEAATQSHLAALQGEGDIPGPENNPPPKIFNTAPTLYGEGKPVAQMSSEEAFGIGGKLNKYGPGTGPAPGIPGKPDKEQYSFLNLEVAKSNQPTAVTQAKAAGGSFLDVADTAGKALSGLGSVASSLGKGLTATAIEAGFFAAAVGGFTGALLVATELLDATFKALAANWEGYSATMAAAEGRSEMELTAHKLRTEYRVGEDASSVTSARTDLHMTFMNLSATVINTIGPLLEIGMESLALILEVLNSILRLLNLLQYIGRPFVQGFHSVASWLRSRFPDNQAQGGNPTDRIMNWITDPVNMFSAIQHHDKDWQHPPKPQSFNINL